MNVRHARPAGFALLLTGLAASCGGRTPDLILIEGTGAGDDASTSGGSSSSGSGSGSSGVASSSGITSSSGISSSSGITSSSGIASSSGISSSSGCSPNGEILGETSALEACWPCVEKGCAKQFSACTADCTCNAALVGAVKCTQSPSNAQMCFSPLANGDATSSALAQCLLGAGADCGCVSPPPEASTGCVDTGGGGSAGNGTCTSNNSETCNGTNYQVLCSCPQAKCVCFGDTTTIIDYPDCPYCGNFGGGPGLTASQLYKLCGFPQ